MCLGLLHQCPGCCVWFTCIDAVSVRVPLQNANMHESIMSLPLPTALEAKSDRKPLMSLDVNELIRQLLLQHAKFLGNDCKVDEGEVSPRKEVPFSLLSHGGDVSLPPNQVNSSDYSHPLGIPEHLALQDIKEEPKIGNNLFSSFLEKDLQNSPDDVQNRILPNNDTTTIKVESDPDNTTIISEKECISKAPSKQTATSAPSYYKKRGRPRKNDSNVKGKSKPRKSRGQNDKLKQDSCEKMVENMPAFQPHPRLENESVDERMLLSVGGKSSFSSALDPANFKNDVEKEDVQFKKNKDSAVIDYTSEIVTQNGKMFPPPIPKRRPDGRLVYACSVDGCKAHKTSRSKMIDHLNIHAGCNLTSVQNRVMLFSYSYLMGSLYGKSTK